MPHTQQDKDRNFRPILAALAKTRGDMVGVFADFCTISACALSLQTREDDYLQTIKPYSRSELDSFVKAFSFLVEEMESAPFADVLGPHYTAIQSKAMRDQGGEFYTPPHVADLMAHLCFDGAAIAEKGMPVTICDPCAGSGGLILSYAKQVAPRQDLLRVTLQDINPIACEMAYINTTLWGIPAEVIHGNTLSMELHRRWANMHWHIVREDQRRALMGIILGETGKNDTASEASNEPPQQFDLFIRDPAA